ncbi:MAG: glycerophosphodiester phosphodiesterase [Bacteroidia bacterium]
MATRFGLGVAVRGWLWLAMLVAGCASTERLAPGNLLNGKILAVVHGCGGFGTYRNTVPPNTVAALEQSLAQGADGVEMDIQVTADGQLAVFHDGLMDIATDCAGCIGDMTWDEVRSCSYQTRNGNLDGHHPVVLLDTLLAQIEASGYQPWVFLNTKHDSPCDPGDDGVNYETFAQLLSEAVHRHDLGDRVIVESMSERFLSVMGERDTTVHLLFDDEDYKRGMEVVRRNDFIGLCISNGQVTADQVAQAHQEGYWLGIWGVRVLGDTQRAVEKGPELVMTDDLLMLRSCLKE